jgi:hypothetical protein
MPSTTSTYNTFALLANLSVREEDDHVPIKGTNTLTVAENVNPQTPIPVTPPSGTPSTAGGIDDSAETTASVDYRSDDNELVGSDVGDDEEADPDLEIMHTTFDLLALEEQHNQKPAFTKEYCNALPPIFITFCPSKISPSTIAAQA